MKKEEFSQLFFSRTNDYLNVYLPKHKDGSDCTKRTYRIALKEFKDYSVLGHINLVDRYQHLYMPGEPLNPPEVMEIIREELSAFAGGVRSAEECAAVIQSRVSIWLAEHS